jgi:hypothetical protein
MLWAAGVRSFVFIGIPASFVHFLKLLVLSFPVGGDILSSAAMPAKSLLHPACPKYRGQAAVSGRQSAGARKKRAIHHSLYHSSFTNPATPPTTLAYPPPFVKRQGVRLRQALRLKPELRAHQAAELRRGVALVSVTSMHSSSMRSF